MRNLTRGLRLQRKRAKRPRAANAKIFAANHAVVAMQLVDRYRDGEDVTELCGAIWDFHDPLTPEGLRQAILEDNPEAGQIAFHAATLLRTAVAELLGVEDKAIVAGLSGKPSLERIPVFVIANATITVHWIRLQPLHYLPQFEGKA